MWKRSAMVDHRVAVTTSAMPGASPPSRKPECAFRPWRRPVSSQNDIHFFRRGTNSCQRFSVHISRPPSRVISSITSLASLTIFMVRARSAGAVGHEVQRLAQIEDDRRHLGDGEVRLFVDQQGWAHERDRHVLHRPVHQLRDRGVAALGPGLSGIGEDGAHELAAERDGPVVEIVVGHVRTSPSRARRPRKRHKALSAQAIRAPRFVTGRKLQSKMWRRSPPSNKNSVHWQMWEFTFSEWRCQASRTMRQPLGSGLVKNWIISGPSPQSSAKSRGRRGDKLACRSNHGQRK